MQLYPHQEIGVQWLLSNPRGGLFDEQGLGKTAQALAAADYLGVQRLLVVAPTSVTHNWKRESRQWSARRSVQIIETGRDRIDRNAGAVIVPHGLVFRPGIATQLDGFDLSVLDEAHMFRSPGAKRTRAFFLGRAAICRRSPRCWLLTGTPIPNDPSEWWAMLAGLAPQRLRKSKIDPALFTYGEFRRRFCVLRPSQYGRGDKVIGAQNVEELRARLAGFYLRRLKSQELQLPPIRFGTVTLTAEPATWPEKLRGMDAALRGRSPEEMLDDAKRSEQYSTWRRLCGVAKAPVAAAMLDEELSNSDGKMVVFCAHTEVVDVLHGALAGHGVLRLTGATPAEERQRLVERFQTDPSVRVFVAQIVAGGVGITLTAASDVVFVEQSFVPGDNAQAADRCHRIGQKQSVLVRFLSLAGSVDEHVTEALARKTEMIHATL